MDFENDAKRQLSITDPSGNESNINNSSSTKYEKCRCGLGCRYESTGVCKGGVNMLSDTKQHLCEYHSKKLGNNNIWYKSEPQKNESPFPQQLGLGMTGDKVKELSNFGGTYKDENDIGDNYEKEDPRYTNNPT